MSSFIFEPLFSWGQELVFLCFGIPSERLFYFQSPMGSYLAFAIYMPVTLKVAKSLLRAPDSVSSRMLICISHKTNFLILVVFSQQKAAFPSGCPDIGSGMPPLGAIIQTNILEASLSAWLLWRWPLNSHGIFSSLCSNNPAITTSLLVYHYYLMVKHLDYCTGLLTVLPISTITGFSPTPPFHSLSIPHSAPRRILLKYQLQHVTPWSHYQWLFITLK